MGHWDRSEWMDSEAMEKVDLAGDGLSVLEDEGRRVEGVPICFGQPGSLSETAHRSKDCFVGLGKVETR